MPKSRLARRGGKKGAKRLSFGGDSALVTIRIPTEMRDKLEKFAESRFLNLQISRVIPTEMRDKLEKFADSRNETLNLVIYEKLKRAVSKLA